LPSNVWHHGQLQLLPHQPTRHRHHLPTPWPSLRDPHLLHLLLCLCLTSCLPAPPSRATEVALQHEVVKLSEELDLVRLELGVAKHEVEAIRRRTASIEQSVANTLASPLHTMAQPAAPMATIQEEDDPEVASLLEQLKANGTPATGRPSRTPTNSNRADREREHLLCPGCAAPAAFIQRSHCQSIMLFLVCPMVPRIVEVVA
jgi:hypothetical protein